MDINEHYKILELNLGATNEEIKAAYKRLAIKYHPDKNNDPGAEDQFKKISESYQYLTNNNNTVRQMNNMNNINNINANELFNQFFKMTEIPFYDFPKSPILITGFFGILVALITLYIANRDYFNSPINLDNINRKREKKENV